MTATRRIYKQSIKRSIQSISDQAEIEEKSMKKRTKKKEVATPEDWEGQSWHSPNEEDEE